MKNQWTVHANGMDHQIQYKGRKLIVDGAQYKLKSANWFIQLIDYAIDFGEVSCRLVVVGNKVDLAVNGRFLGTGEPYEPIANVPIAVSIFAGISAVLGFLMNKWLGLCIGILLGSMYFNMFLKKRSMKPVIIAFVIAVIGQIALGVGIAILLAPYLYG